jgi:superfamily II DNA or RNA helicase
MFSDPIESQASSKGAYDRGVVLHYARAVHFAQVKETDSDVVELEGTVDGNYQSLYRVSLSLDTMFGGVAKSHCTCPAFASDTGLCKHCIAMALSYCDDPEGARRAAHLAQRKGEPQQPSTGEARASSAYRTPRQKATRKPREAETSVAISNMISAYAKRAEKDAKRLAALQAAAEEFHGKPVTLVPTLSQDASQYSYADATQKNWSLKLRIQRGKAGYVVKDMDSLVNAWEQGAHVSYGKNLAFAHVHSAFDERSNRLVEFIAHVVKAQKALFESRERYYYGSRSASLKELPLSPSDAIDLLDLFQGGTLQYVPEGYGSNAHTVHVVDGDAALSVKIAKGDAGGYDLQMPRDAECVASGDRMYLVFDGKARRCSADLVHDLGEFYATLLPAPHPMHIREEDMTAFCAAVLPQLRKHAILTEAEGVEEFTPRQAEFTFRISLDEYGYVRCDTQVAYGSETVNLFEDATATQPVRHVSREIEAQQAVRTFFPCGHFDTPRYDRATGRQSSGQPHRHDVGSYYSSNPWSSHAYGGTWDDLPHRMPTRNLREPDAPWFAEDDDNALFLLITEGYGELARLGDVLVSENLSGREVLPPPAVNVTANVRSGLLDIEVDAAGMAPADLVSYLASYKRKQRFVRLANGDIVRMGEAVEALANLADGLGIRDEDLVEGARNVPANRTLFVDALLKKSGIRFSRNDAFRSIVRDFDTVADGDVDVPAPLAQTMRPYQCDGFQWLCMLGKLGFGGILADDMGLGKTLQMIAYLLARKRDCAPDDHLPSLVVCPASLVYNWEAEARRFAPGLSVVPVTGARAARNAVITGAGQHDLLVTSYDLMKRDADLYAGQQFHCVVLDEAQYIKNHATKAAKCAKQLPAQVRFALTGTPIENRLSELWSIFDFLMPGMLGSHDQFGARFEAAIAAGDEACAQRLRALIDPFILRRLKEDVLADLPDKNESVVFTHLEGEQEKLYHANASKLALQLAKQLPEEFAQDKLRILAELTKLRQICCDPHLTYDNYEGDSAKLETCMELIRNAVDGGHRILLFSQFTSMLDIIGHRLAAQKLPFLTFTGSTSKEERAARVDRFQRGDAPVFLISLKAGGTGLNLTAADIVIHYDPWWNVAAQNQATDRAHRIGQTRNVSVFKLIAKDTIEERIVEMQEEKRHLAEQVIGGEAIGSAKLSRDDILALLGSAVLPNGGGPHHAP